MNLFELFATISLDSSGYEEGLGNAEQKTQSFGSKLKSGITGAARTASVAIGAVSAAGAALAGTMVKGASETAAYGDNIDKMSQKMGISAEAYQEWDAILQHSGSSIESLKVSMKTLATAAENGNEAFAKLGISQEQLASMSQEDLFSTVISQLQQMEEGTERTYLTSQLLGRGATELGALLNTSAEDTEKMRQRVHELGGVMSNEAVKSSAAFQDNLQDLQTAFSGIKRGIASDILPGLSTLMAGFTSLIAGEDGAEEALQSGFDTVLDSIINGISKISSYGKKLIPVLVSSIVEALPKLAAGVADIVMVLGETLIENTPMILSAVLEIITTIGNSIIENLPAITEMITQAVNEIALLLSDPEMISTLLIAVVTIIQTLGTSIIENIPMLLETVMQVITNITSYMAEQAPLVADAALQMMITLANGLIEALPQVLAQIPVIIDNITTTILNLLPKMVETGITLLTSLVQALPQIITTIVAAVPQIIESICNAITTLVPALVDAGIMLFTALVDNLPFIIDTIVAALPQIIDSLVDAFSKAGPTIVDAGVKLFTSLINNMPKILRSIASALADIMKAIFEGIGNAIPTMLKMGGQLISGLWQGISNVGDWLREKISGFFGGVVSSIKNFFGIKSPSRLFAGIGEMLDRGLAKGIEDYADVAVKATEEMADDVFNATDGDLDFTAGVNGASGTAAGRSGLVINVYGSEGQDVEELAEIVSQKIAFGYAQEQAVFA